MRAPARAALAAAPLLAVVLAALALSAGAAAAPREAAAPPRVAAKAWIVVDGRDGDVLASRGAARRLPVASTTKLMTAYVALKELPPGRVVRAAPYSATYGESLLELRPRQRISVRDLLYGLILRSGNDAAHALAVAAAGSERRFVARMNRYAAALGLADTRYANPIGLDERGNRSSARDLAALARRLLRIPAFARMARARSAVLRSVRPRRRIESTNRLLDMVPWATGVKTGHTFGAGWCLVASGRRKGVELISVVLGAPSEEARYASSLALLGWGFSRYRKRTPVRAGRALAEPAIRYSGGSLPLRAPRTLTVGVRRGQRLELRVRAPREVEGPIRRGASLGRATVLVDGRPAASTRLLAGRSIPAASGFDRARDFVSRHPAPIAGGLFVILMVAMLLVRRSRRRSDRRERDREVFQ